MKNACLVLIIAVMLAGKSFAVPQTQPSNTVRAERVIHFDASPEKREQLIETMQKMAPGHDPDGALDAAEAAAQATVGGASTMVNGALFFSPIVSVSINPPTDEITLSVDLRNLQRVGQFRASEAADEAVKQLIQRLTPPARENLERRKEQLDELEGRRQELTEGQKRSEDQLREKSGSVDVSPATIRQLFASLQTQSETAALDIVAKQARSDALAEQIAKFSDQIKQKVDGDPVAAELEKVVEARQKDIDRIKNLVQRNIAAQGEVDAAIGNLAEAKAKLLERREAAVAAAGGDVVATWNKELMTLAVDLAELRARSKAIDDRLNHLKDVDPLLDRIDQASAEFADVTKQITALQPKLAELRAEYFHERINFSVTSRNDVPSTQP